MPVFGLLSFHMAPAFCYAPAVADTASSSESSISQTALIKASKKGHVQVVKELRKHEADIRRTDMFLPEHPLFPLLILLYSIYFTHLY